MDEVGLELWTRWARGPIFRACLAFMVLGLLRHLLLWAAAAVRGAPGSGPRRRRPRGGRLRDRLAPLRLIRLACVIVVSLFLAGHVVLWKKSLGISWPSLPGPAADALTLMGVALTVLIALGRTLSRRRPRAGGGRDALFPVAVFLAFASGFLVRHPWLNPLPYEITFLLHLMSANLLLLLVPLTPTGRPFFLPRRSAGPLASPSAPAAEGVRLPAMEGRSG